MSHISLVQTPVNAAGKKSTTVFFVPKLLLSLTSTSPEACLDLRVKSGAFVPTAIAIVVRFLFVFGYWVNDLPATELPNRAPVSIRDSRGGPGDAKGGRARNPFARLGRRRSRNRTKSTNSVQTANKTLRLIRISSDSLP